MVAMPTFKDPNLAAEMADLAPRMASYWTTEAEAGVEGARQLADAWRQLSFRLRADIAELERQKAMREHVLDIRKAQGRLPDGSVR